MKRFTFIATALIALASCSDSEFVGDPTLQGAANGEGAISFGSSTTATTRATVGGILAAEKLDKKFVVEGIKTVSATTTEVFDNYNVEFTENTSGTSASNSANWEYVGLAKNDHSAITGPQTIKYWDFAASQYDFWAYSLGDGSATVDGMADNATLTSSAYTITGTKSDLEKVYISNLVTTYPISSSNTPHIGDEVNLTFRSFLSKIRIGLYETIPGYSVKNVQFYPAGDGTAAATPTLYATGSNLPAFASTDPYKATVKVYFPTITSSNYSNSDYNVAHVAQTSSDKASNISFTALSYGDKERNEKTSGTTNWLARSTSAPTWAGDGTYTTILPNENGEVMTLKVDYTLEPIDGASETITVHGAVAIIPAKYTQWKANYAYTYIFKISDNTNGKTDVGVDRTGLYPITLDAVVANSQDDTQETITTVASPSITTYSITSEVVKNNEYKTTDDIYVSATSNGAYLSLTSKAVLYDITKSSSPYAATEAEILDALTKYTTLASETYTGRNSIVLTPTAEGCMTLTETSIPLVDGNSVTVSAGEVALIPKNKLTAGHYYAFVYQVTAPNSPTTKSDYTTVKTSSFTSATDVSSYYTTEDGITYSSASGTYVEGQKYYSKHDYNETDGNYAVKVIKVN